MHIEYEVLFWCLDDKEGSYMMSRRVHGKWLGAMGLSFC